MEQKEIQEILLRLGRLEQKIDSSHETDRLEQLFKRIEEYRREATEKEFLNYLKFAEGNLQREKIKIEDIAAQIDRNYATYKKKTAKMPAAPVVRSMEELQAAPFVENMEEPQAAPVVQSMEELQAAPFVESIEEPQAAPVVQSMEEFQAAPVVQSMEEPQAAPAKEWKVETNTGKSSAIVKEDPKGMEFKIGAVLLSVIGALFILTALITFGMNFMNNLAQGVFLYVIAALVLLLSELFIRPRADRFSRSITGIGIAACYIGTIINYLYLHSINGIAAILITIVTALISLTLSRKRDSASLRVISILGCYIAFLPLNKFTGLTEFLIPAVMLLVINVISILYPIRKTNKAVPAIHMTANVLVTAYLMGMASYSELNTFAIFMFVLIMTATIYAIFIRSKSDTMLNVFLIVSLLAMSGMLVYCVTDQDFLIAGSILYLAAGGAAFYFLRERKIKWVLYYCFSGFLFFSFWIEGGTMFVIATCILLIASKLLSRRREVAISEIVITGISALVLFGMHENPWSSLLFGLLILSAAALFYFKTAEEAILLTAAVIYLILVTKPEVFIPVSVAILTAGVIAFGKIEMFRGKNYPLIYYAGSGFLVVFVLMTISIDQPLSISAVLLTGLVYIMTMVKKEFRYITAAAFLSFMIFAFRIDIPVVVSILLMILAIAGVSAGFLLHTKNVRLYGLIQALFVCAKLVIYDFMESETIEKIILFLAVGMLALAISYLYIRLEKSELGEKQENL